VLDGGAWIRSTVSWRVTMERFNYGGEKSENTKNNKGFTGSNDIGDGEAER